jgi:hypothetical protein
MISCGIELQANELRPFQSDDLLDIVRYREHVPDAYESYHLFRLNMTFF